MFEFYIDNEILDEVEEVLNKGELTQLLLGSTVNFTTAAFMVNAIVKAVKEAREELNGGEDE